ncbi:hypothetical protein GDO78_000928 [Eleutherodactylus coqui]|uniref:Tyrosine-protein phosphatase domain-containing protein n=1 Tax=Eleutherodactylus coqui TaxID=57060 RepID=A0A8J6FSI2_ELECQ|nr:hypothetical protein GDO78_000928 [Eleutherodactylus coqui]
MAELVLCTATDLYNILNQSTKFSKLAEPNYLCLLDARSKREYNESHIITARRAKQEIDEFQPYPIEIIPGLLYMGDLRQANDKNIRKDLKIKSYVNVSLEPTNLSLPSEDAFHIPQPDSCDSDLLRFFPSACQFIDSHMRANCAVLVFSKLGISRSSVVVLAYVIHYRKCTLQEAWNHVLKCKTNMRPNQGFVQQLSEWEKIILGHPLTDISNPRF